MTAKIFSFTFFGLVESGGVGSDFETMLPFIQIADPQYGGIGYFDFLETHDMKEYNWDLERKYFRTAIEIINSLNPQPKFIAVCGDMIEGYPKPEQDEPLKGNILTKRSDMLHDYLEDLKLIDESIPVFHVPGNHDIGNDPTVDDIEKYKKDFNTSDYFTKKFGSTLLVFLNSQIMKNSAGCEDMAKEQWGWLENTIFPSNGEASKHDAVYVFQHIPPFIQTVNEEEEPYFNLPNTARMRLLKLLGRHKNVRCMLCGHLHYSNKEQYKDEDTGHSFPILTTTSLSFQLKKGDRSIRLCVETGDSLKQELWPIMKNGSVNIPNGTLWSAL